MNLKVILYIITLFFAIWAIDSINLANIFKKNRYFQARILVMMLIMALTYLVTNFLYDFFTYMM